MSKFVGQQMSAILSSVANALLEIESRDTIQPYEFDDDTLKDATKIFTSVCFDKLWHLLNKEGLPELERAKRINKLASGIRSLIKDNLGVDTYDFYKNNNVD